MWGKNNKKLPTKQNGRIFVVHGCLDVCLLLNYFGLVGMTMWEVFTSRTSWKSMPSFTFSIMIRVFLCWKWGIKHVNGNSADNILWSTRTARTHPALQLLSSGRLWWFSATVTSSVFAPKWVWQCWAVSGFCVNTRKLWQRGKKCLCTSRVSSMKTGVMTGHSFLQGSGQLQAHGSSQPTAWEDDRTGSI